jgi:hypothetical protein
MCACMVYPSHRWKFALATNIASDDHVCNQLRSTQSCEQCTCVCVCVCVFVIIATVSTVTVYSNILSSVIAAVLDIKINAQLATSVHHAAIYRLLYFV